MRRPVAWVAVALVAIGLVGYRAWSRANAPIDVVVAGARRGAITASFTADGIVKGRTAELAPRMLGRIAELPVAEGASVRAGAVVARIESQDLEAAVREADAAVLAARAVLRAADEAAAAVRRRIRTDEAQAAAQLAAAQARYNQAMSGPRPQEIAVAEQRARATLATLAAAESAARRARELYDAGGLARADLDEAEARHRVAAAEHRAALETLDLVRAGARPEEQASLRAQRDAAAAQLTAARDGRKDIALHEAEISAARARMAQAVAAAARVRAALGEAVLIAPFGGLVSRVAGEVGEIAPPGVTLVTIIDPADVHISADIADEDAAKVRVGQTVVVTAPSHPGRRFQARVTELAPQAERQPDTAVRTRVVRAKIRLASHEALRPGLEVDVEGEAAIVADALVVPTDAVMLRDTRMVVIVVEGGFARERTVRTGYATFSDTEIVEGLREGAVVVVGGKERAVDGRRVRIVNVLGD